MKVILVLSLLCGLAVAGSWTTSDSPRGWSCLSSLCGFSSFYCTGLQPDSFTYSWGIDFTIEDQTPRGQTVTQIAVAVEGGEGCVAPASQSPGGPVFNASETVVEYIPSPHQLPADHSESTPPVGVPIVIAPAVNREAVGQVIWNAGFFCGAACPSCKQIGSVRSSVYADGFPGWRYGGENVVYVGTSTAVCIAKVTVTVYYGAPTPVPTTTPSSAPPPPTPTPTRAPPPPTPTPTRAPPPPTPTPTRAPPPPTPTPTRAPPPPTPVPTPTGAPASCTEDSQCHFPQGVCLNGLCHCSSFYYGPTCAECLCPGHPPCNGNGYCNSSMTHCSCQCNSGYYGCDCSSHLLPCPGQCAHGRCNHFTGQCVCEEGWQGQNCNTPIKSCPDNCSGHGSCNTTTGHCTCEQGYKGLNCGTPITDCIPENCNNQGTCNHTTGHCICQPGFAGPGCGIHLCQNNCSGHGKCNHFIGECYCYPGYYGCSCNSTTEGPSRPKPTEPILPNPTPCPLNCSGHGKCNFVEGVCYCYSGWQGCDCSRVADSSTDLELDMSVYERAVCSNQGTYKKSQRGCVCDAGFVGKKCQFSAEIIQTPFGFHPKECTHEIAEHEFVQEVNGVTEIYTIHENTGEKVFRKRFACPAELLQLKEEAIRSNGFTEPPVLQPVHSTESDLQSPPHQTWQTWAVTGISESAQSYSAKWKVPSVPSSVQSQTFFLFIGLTEQEGGGEIYQPVLQYGGSGSGGGMYYSIASWIYNGPTSISYGSQQAVSVGDVIQGSITASATGVSVETKDLSNGATSVVNASGRPALYAGYVTLEMYGVLSCEQLPSGSTTFSDIAIKAGGRSITPRWTTKTPVRQCGESTSASGSSVTITF